MSDEVSELVTATIAELSRRPSIEQYAILEEENRRLRELYEVALAAVVATRSPT